MKNNSQAYKLLKILYIEDRKMTAIELSNYSGILIKLVYPILKNSIAVGRIKKGLGRDKKIYFYINPLQRHSIQRILTDGFDSLKKPEIIERIKEVPVEKEKIIEFEDRYIGSK